MLLPASLAVPPILAGFPDPMLAFDTQDRVVAWNPAAERVYLLPTADALHTSIWMLVPRKRQRPFARALEAVRQDGQWSGELLTLAANGSIRQVEARWAAMPDGVVVGIHVEVGERRRQEVRDRRASRWATARALAAAAADSLPAAAGPVRELLARTGRGADPTVDPVYHGNGAWVLVLAIDPLVRELSKALLDAVGYTVVVANNRSAAGQIVDANRDKLRAAVLEPATDTPAVVRELHRYRAMLPVVSLPPIFEPTDLLREVAEAVGQDTAFDPDSEVM